MKYQFKCHRCDVIIEVEETMEQHGHVAHICSECGDLMESHITGGEGFHLKGVSWARDNYCNHGHLCDKK